MKFLKTFENQNTEMSRVEMCKMLNSMGYNMNELEGCSDSELANICREAEMRIPMPGKNEAKKEKFTKDSMKRPGALRKKMNKKTREVIKEHQENENYMFFSNVENICRICKEILAMDKNEVDRILSDGHAWAVDHVATSKDDMEEVYGFLKTHNSDKRTNQIHDMDSNFIQTYKNYKGFPEN